MNRIMEIAQRQRRFASRSLLKVGWLALLLAPLALTAGCGDGKPPKGEVVGTVTVDGAPPKEGAIAFIPADGMSSTAGGVIEEGKYAAIVPPGKAKVEIRVSKVVGQKKLYDTPDSPVRPIMAEVLPARYNDQTELTVDVQVGPNQHDFDLKTK